MKHTSRSSGFTLIEMLVSLALFAVVVLIAVGALLSLVGANHKAQALQSVMNNLNISLDAMVRNIRAGVNYSCSASQNPQVDCPTGGTQITFTDHTGKVVTYTYVAASGSKPGQIQRTENSQTVTITSSEVSINSMTFYVVGSSRTDQYQPKVLIVISGTAGSAFVKTQTTFHIQATASQRVIDI